MAVTNWIVMCGLVRELLEFRLTLDAAVSLRRENLVEGIVLSTWRGQVNRIDGLRDELQQLGIILVESPEPKVAAGAMVQPLALLHGLMAVPDGCNVWKIRTDKTSHLVRVFRPFLESGPDPIRRFGEFPTLFESKVAALTVSLTSPLYLHDISFYGKKADLEKMVATDISFDALYQDIAAESRPWTMPFLRRFSTLHDFMLYVNNKAFSRHLVRHAELGEQQPLPDFFQYMLAFNTLALYSQIALVEAAPYGGDMTFAGAMGKGVNSGVRSGTPHSRRMTILNSQAALDALVEGRLPDDSTSYADFLDNLSRVATVYAGRRRWNRTDEQEAEIFEKLGLDDMPLLNRTHRLPILNKPESSLPGNSSITASMMAEMHAALLTYEDHPQIDWGHFTRLFFQIRGESAKDFGIIYYELALAFLQRTTTAYRSLAIGLLGEASCRNYYKAITLLAEKAFFEGVVVPDKGALRARVENMAFKEVVACQYLFACMLETGWGGEVDHEQAIHWFKQANKHSFEVPEIGTEPFSTRSAEQHYRASRGQSLILKRLNNIRRVLILRSGQPELVLNACRQVNSARPDAEIDLLCQPDWTEHFRPLFAWNALHEADGGFFDVDRMARSQIESLKAREYDLVVVVYSNSGGAGYWNVLSLASALKPRHICAFNNAGTWLKSPEKVSVSSIESGLIDSKQIVAIHNRHVGQRAFILGMGPSLKIDILDRLKDEITFACNKIFLAFDQTDWRPTYYSVIDLLVAENNAEKIRSLNLRSIHCSNLADLLGKGEDIIYVRSLKNPGLDGSEIKFSDDLLKGVYGGRTVIYFQMQLAYHMGIRELYLLGLDFDFVIPDQKAGKTAHGEDVLVHGGEINHFHPDYRAKGEKWSMPQLDYQKKAFIAAREFFERNGGTILNASRKSKLNVFPRVTLEEIMRSGPGKD